MIYKKSTNSCGMHNETLTKKENNFQTNYIPKTSNFHELPKIYKSKEIEIAVKTQKSKYIEIPDASDLKFRPIVAGTSCPTDLAN